MHWLSSKSVFRTSSVTPDERGCDGALHGWRCIEEQTTYTHQAENQTYDIKVLSNKVSGYAPCSGATIA